MRRYVEATTEAIKELGVHAATLEGAANIIGIPRSTLQKDLGKYGWVRCQEKAFYETLGKNYPPEPLGRTRLPKVIQRRIFGTWGLWIADEGGLCYTEVSSSQIAECAGCSPSTVRMAFAGHKLSDAILTAAVEFRVLPIIGQGIAMRDPLMENMQKTLKEAALDVIF